MSKKDEKQIRWKYLLKNERFLRKLESDKWNGISQQANIWPKSTIKTVEKGLKYAKS